MQPSSKMNIVTEKQRGMFEYTDTDADSNTVAY